MQAFVICLERRKAQCDQNIGTVSSVFPKCQRFKAVDASRLDPADPRISDFARYHMKHGIESDFMHLSKMGAVGCALSHIALWQKCVELNAPIVVVEDDVHLTAKMQRQVRQAVAEIPASAHFAGLMYIPYNHIDQPRECTGNWCRVRQGYAGTQMYYVTPKGCSILLRGSLPIVAHVDAYVGYVSAVHEEMNAVYWKEQIYTTWKFLKDNGASSIGHVAEGRVKKMLPNGNAFYLAFAGLFVVLLVAVVVMACRGRR